MRRLLSTLFVPIALCACASPAADGGFEPAWSQRPEERGRLPTGQVVAVERVDGRDPIPLVTQASAGSVSGAGVSANTAGVIAATTGASAGRLYRYTLRMGGGVTRRAEGEQAFKVGDCVAIRTDAAERTSIVSALAEECR